MCVRLCVFARACTRLSVHLCAWCVKQRETNRGTERREGGGQRRGERASERAKGREWREVPGWKAGNPVTMRPGGGWGLLDLFEDQEEDVEEARETQTVVGRESDGSKPAQARWDATLSPLSLSIVRALSIGVPRRSSPAGTRPRRLATIAAIQDRRTLSSRDWHRSEYILRNVMLQSASNIGSAVERSDWKYAWISRM